MLVKKVFTTNGSAPGQIDEASIKMRPPSLFHEPCRLTVAGEFYQEQRFWKLGRSSLQGFGNLRQPLICEIKALTDLLRIKSANSIPESAKTG